MRTFRDSRAQFTNNVKELIVMRVAIRLGIIAAAALFAITAFAATTIAAQAGHPARPLSTAQPDRFDNE
jgi:hypothetical protein